MKFIKREKKNYFDLKDFVAIFSIFVKGLFN